MCILLLLPAESRRFPLSPADSRSVPPIPADRHLPDDGRAHRRGRQESGHRADDDGRRGPYLGGDHLTRVLDPAQAPAPPGIQLLPWTGPTHPDAELALFRQHRVSCLVTKNSGGPMTAAKLAAARQLPLPVIMVDRPPLPADTAVAATVEQAVDWVRGLTHRR